MSIETRVDKAKNADDHQSQQDEVKGQDGIGDEWVEGLICEIAGVIEGIAALLPGWKS
jgi:hypothetical protein